MSRLLYHSAALAVAVAALGVAGCGPDAREAGPAVQAPSSAGPRKIEVLVLSAKWCGVCRQVPPVLEKLRAEFPEATFQELDVDADENLQLARENDASAIPYFITRVDGRVVGRIRGLMPLEELVPHLKQTFAAAASGP